VADYTEASMNQPNDLAISFNGTIMRSDLHHASRQRHGGGRLPAGKVLKEIDVPGKMPTIICFGGPDGGTAYVTEAAWSRQSTPYF
jgi:hypothetical protein